MKKENLTILLLIKNLRSGPFLFNFTLLSSAKIGYVS